MNSHRYNSTNQVICFNNFKVAALYFDRVLPINMAIWRGDRVAGDFMVGYPEDVPSRALSHLIDRIEVKSPSFTHVNRVLVDIGLEAWGDFAKSVMPYANTYMPNIDNKNQEENDLIIFNEYKKLSSAYLSNAKLKGTKPIRELFKNYAKKVGFDNFCVAMFDTKDNNQLNSDPSITLSNLNLIDTSNTDWKQIIEVRLDKDSHQKLARLRLFLSKNYADCSYSFIEDDISLQLYDYEQVCKKFGFETMTSSISALLNSNNLQASIGAGIIAGVFGGPITGVAVGTTIEIAKIAIVVAEKKHELKDWKNGHNLAYIIETRSKLC